MADSNSVATKSINTIRALAMDAVQAANSGHPGTPMAMAPVCYQLWQHHLRFDPNTNVVEAHMSRLRGKLHRPAAGEMITTIRGAGYRLGPPA